MKFGMFLELQPRPGVDTSEREVFQRELELGILAEKLGFDYVWMCEHHNIPERAYCSVPEIFLTALSQHTSTIRLGFAVLELIPPINHVIRAAERVAALDIMSGGQVDVAVAPIRVAQDLGPFSVKADEVEDMVEEGLRLLPRLWGEEPVSHDGKYYHLSSVRVVPKPLQKPHPPLWQASTARHHAKVGGRGIGLLTSTHNAGYKHIGTYREALGLHPSRGKR